MYTITLITIANTTGVEKVISLPFIPQIGSKLSIDVILEDAVVEDVFHNIELDGTFTTTITVENQNYKNAKEELLSIGFTAI